ncbi:TonB-dependent receptor [Sphingomonas sp. PP-CE-1G-424]|uniref:TonB-dependent receptor domain-containing protein n=1 Tax=Sphingomonas sp. PP-CE-1G-424 TaxID=2135658 RepID=UPI0010541A06|nr:TonB-dependent receptor [Sphingomonas sp. PP-CE-1G-424]TCP72559.1 TonB-dependent receptor-like protein [Sphingomonas sp. PP-CE-1G-424]
MNMYRLLGATALVSVLAGLPSYAAAQTAPDTTTQTATDAATASPTVAPQAAPAEDTNTQEITVTGSRISNPNGVSTVPITSISAVELQQTGNLSVGDVLNNLPALASTFSQQNSTRFLGTGGLSLVDLYGLGTQRTLVLVNGRRHVGSDILSNAVSPDINTFPTDLIESVDIVTGGNSAVYGSDAIAGVVNFRLKQNFEGLQVRGQGGVSQYGDAGSYYGSLLAGKNFADGRGNIAVNLEYARQNDFYGSERNYLRRVDGFVVVDSDPAGSDGIPDRVFYRDIRSGTYSNGGLVSFASGRNTFASGATNPNAGVCGRDSAQNPFNCNFLFQSDGTLVAQTGARAGLAAGTTPAGSYIGGNGSTLREGNSLQILPQLDRYSANVIGHFDVSDAFVPFFEAKYVRTNSFGTGASGPAFISGGTLADSREQIRLDNPYLSAQARSVITQQLLAANPAATVTDATRFSLRRNLLDFGVRSEAAKRETYRFVGGFRGTFNDDWKYELTGNYGEFHEATRVAGNLNVQRFLLANDTTRNAAGQIVCRSQVSPAAQIPYVDNDAILAADVAACVPVNPFGEGNVTQAAKDYVLQSTISRGKITQLDISGFVAGDSSQLFNLPGGPARFSLGGEYRRETAYFRADPLVEAGYTFYNALSEFAPPSFQVKEAYGELQLPLLKDLPLIQDLTVSGAGRVSDYKGSAGTNWTYNFGVDYSPIPDLRFRAQYARAVRAPNLSDLYSAAGQNFAPGFVDPCSARQIGTGSSTRAANCAAQGIPASYDFVFPSGSLEIVSGGNPNLSVEKSDSYTYGGVLQPRFVPGLTLSVDYFNIKVADVITAPTAQQIANACYDAATVENQFCNLFSRYAANTVVDGADLSYTIKPASLQQTLLNYAKLQVRGINTDLAYTRRFGEDLSLNLHFIWTHNLQSDSFLNPADPGRADTDLGEVGQPKDALNVNVQGSKGPFFMSYQYRFLSKQLVNGLQYEDVNTFQGRPPQNADYADILYYPSVSYHDVRLGVNIEGGSNFYFGVDNLTNELPPLSSTAVGAGTGIYEPVGRRFYAGFTAKF